MSSSAPPGAPVPEGAAAGRPSLWHRLTEPHRSIEEVGVRHLARLLSSFLLVNLLLGVVVTLVTPWFRPDAISWCILYVLLVGTAYATSRTRHFLWAARVGTAVLCLVPMLSTYFIISQEATDSLAEALWLLLGIVFGSLYFPARVMAGVVLICMAGVGALALYLPSVSLRTALHAEWLIFILSVLVIISRRAQMVVERSRLALLERRERELVRLNRNMETMLYVISHDLKEPLRGIQSFSDVVNRRYADKLDDRGQDYLRRVVRGAVRMRELLDDIVQLLRAHRAAPPDVSLPGELLVRAALERLESRIEETGARVDVMPGLPSLRVDRTWGIAAIQNLVDNALKHTVDGARPEVEIAPYRGDDGVGVVVRDRGPGVPEAYAERIFDLFRRAVGREVPGTGAGLAIVRHVARRHGGEAWMRPRAGGGSEFVITFQTDGDVCLERAESGRWDPLVIARESSGSIASDAAKAGRGKGAGGPVDAKSGKPG